MRLGATADARSLRARSPAFRLHIPHKLATNHVERKRGVWEAVGRAGTAEAQHVHSDAAHAQSAEVCSACRFLLPPLFARPGGPRARCGCCAAGRADTDRGRHRCDGRRVLGSRFGETLSSFAQELSSLCSPRSLMFLPGKSVMESGSADFPSSRCVKQRVMPARFHREPLFSGPAVGRPQPCTSASHLALPMKGTVASGNRFLRSTMRALSFITGKGCAARSLASSSPSTVCSLRLWRQHSSSPTSSPAPLHHQHSSHHFRTPPCAPRCLRRQVRFLRRRLRHRPESRGQGVGPPQAGGVRGNHGLLRERRARDPRGARRARRKALLFRCGLRLGDASVFAEKRPVRALIHR